MQLSRTREGVLDLMSFRQMGHSIFRFIHSLMQKEQKLWAQFKVTACNRNVNTHVRGVTLTSVGGCDLKARQGQVDI